MKNTLLLDLIKGSVWNSPITQEIDQEIYNEMKQHAISTLVAPILSSLNIQDQLRQVWKNSILQQVSFNVQYKHFQSELPISVPYVILKGTSVAQYYPHPELRTMGDIDIITARDDYLTACNMMLQNGYSEILSHSVDNDGRHRSFRKNGVIVEIHKYFALLNNSEKAELLDNLIIANINPTHVLPNQINGLVLLEHINQHLEDGLGLRQIIDWMMFVDKCLSDEECDPFLEKADKIGLKTLAIVTTRMCEIYLGLSNRSWCAMADEALCGQLIDYIITCGNFGNKRTSDSDIGQNVFLRARSLRSTIQLLQERGLINWKTIRQYPFFSPFAWIYQINRYLKKGFGRKGATAKLKTEYRAAKQRNALFDALGVKQTSKGLVVFHDGKYIKK